MINKKINTVFVVPYRKIFSLKNGTFFETFQASILTRCSCLLKQIREVSIPLKFDSCKIYATV